MRGPVPDFPTITDKTIMVAITDFTWTKESPAHGDSVVPQQRCGKKSRVLVVEDHEDTRFMLKVMLEQRGIDVLEASDGEEAITITETERPDLILMDGNLPVLNGISATRRIRRSRAMKDVPIIFMSAHAMPIARAQAFGAGCDSYLEKPIDFDEWDRVLKQFLEVDGTH